MDRHKSIRTQAFLLLSNWTKALAKRSRNPTQKELWPKLLPPKIQYKRDFCRKQQINYFTPVEDWSTTLYKLPPALFLFTNWHSQLLHHLMCHHLEWFCHHPHLWPQQSWQERMGVGGLIDGFHASWVLFWVKDGCDRHNKPLAWCGSQG